MEEPPGQGDATGEAASASPTLESVLREVARMPTLRAMPSPGQVVGGKYRIERLIGTGGMGAVFAAQHEVLKQRVALKVMRAESADASAAAARFLNEARAAAQIEGDHVARVFDVGQLADGSPFIAMELLEGADLSSVLAARGSLPVDETMDYVLQALEAVAQAHALGIVHRDLKPANLFLARRRDGTQIVKVLDFGISKAIDPLSGVPQTTLTRSSSLVGSPLYMAPEQLRSAKTVDARADLWAIGVILFEALAGRRPFGGQTIAEVFASILERPVPLLRTFRPDLSESMEAVVMRCLSKDPAERFESAAELAKALLPLAPHHARPSVDRIVRLLDRPAVSEFATTIAAAPSAGGLEKKTTSGAPWSNTRGVVPRRRERVRVLVAGLLITAALGAFGLYATLHRQRGAGRASATGDEPEPHGAMAAASEGCVPGSERCDDTTPQACSDGRQWTRVSVMAGRCGAECTPGSAPPRCNDKTPQTCGQAGRWLDESPCPFACRAGACSGVCSPGVVQCAGPSSVQTCDSSGQWEKEIACKSNLCREGACTTPARAPISLPKPRQADCEPNYYLDGQGEKRFKPECFGVASSPKKVR